MANKVESLFLEVLAKLPKEGLRRKPDWPDVPADDSHPYNIEEDFQDTWEVSVMDLSVGDFWTPELPDEERQAIYGAIRIRGFDALAFYKSRRFMNDRPVIGKWGIFYFVNGLDFLSKEINEAYPGYGKPTHLARDFLYAHEHFHFRADLHTLMLEAVLGRHLYVPLRNALRGRRSQFVEEALANREAFGWAKQKKFSGIREFAWDFMDLQPNAYSRFEEDISILAGEWVANTIDLAPPNCSPRGDVAPWLMTTPRDLLRPSLCPQYLIHCGRLKNWIDPAWMPPPVTEVIDGPKVTRLLSGRYSNMKRKWEGTKKKLVEDRLRRGLNFKPWSHSGRKAYSVRVDDSFRAHMRNLGGGKWEAFEIGPHAQMGHG